MKKHIISLFLLSIVAVFFALPHTAFADAASVKKEGEAFYKTYTDYVKKETDNWVNTEIPAKDDNFQKWLDGKQCTKDGLIESMNSYNCIVQYAQKEAVKKANKKYKDEIDKITTKYKDAGLSFDLPDLPYPDATAGYTEGWFWTHTDITWGKLASLDSKSVKKAGTQVLISSPGLFTKADVQTFGACNIEEVKKEMKESVGEPKIKSQSEAQASTTDDGDASLVEKLAFTMGEYKDKVGNEMAQTFKNFANDFEGHLFGTDCEGNDLSVVAQFLNISRTLNITDNPYIMSLVHITQQIAFTFTIVIIAFFALMFTTGYQNMDPVKFAIRLFFCILVVNYLPWLMQDVLNLNNVLVYNLSNLQFKFDKIDGNTSEILMGTFTALFHSLFTGESIGKSLLLLILAFIMAIIALVPMLRIITWWYLRLLRIFLGAIVGPFMVMLGALPNTMDKTQKWMQSFINEVFSQLFMALALLMVSVIIGNIGDFGETIGVSWFGRAMLVYASIFFLAEVPSFSKGLIGAGFNGGDEKGIAKNFRGHVKKSSSAVAGTTIGAVAGLGVGLGMASKGGKLSQMSNKLAKQGGLAGSLANKVGHGITRAAGGTVKGTAKAGVGTVKAGGNTVMGLGKGIAGKGAGSGKGVFGKTGSVVGTGINKTGKAIGATHRHVGQKIGVKKDAIAANMKDQLANAKGNQAKGGVRGAVATAQLAAMATGSAMGASMAVKKEKLKSKIRDTKNKIEDRTIGPVMNNIYEKSGLPRRDLQFDKKPTTSDDLPPKGGGDGGSGDKQKKSSKKGNGDSKK